MITIKKIAWLDENTYEGEVMLIDSYQKELVCFTYSVAPEGITFDTISTSVNSELLRSDESSYLLTRTKNFEYYIVGKVIDKKKTDDKMF
ncbi:hypothetical protein AB1I63_00910 [Streptococcus pneumoniae]